MLKVLVATAALLMGGVSASAAGYSYQAETCLGTIARTKQINEYHDHDIPKAQVNLVLDDIATICGMELASLRNNPARHRREH